MTLSAIILTKNEEGNIEACMKSVSFADEIVIIDDNSIDQTISIAQKHGAVVYRHKLKNFSDQRNFGILQAKGYWILFIDADERVPSKLRQEIQAVVQ